MHLQPFLHTLLLLFTSRSSSCGKIPLLIIQHPKENTYLRRFFPFFQQHCFNSRQESHTAAGSSTFLVPRTPCPQIFWHRGPPFLSTTLVPRNPSPLDILVSRTPSPLDLSDAADHSTQTFWHQRPLSYVPYEILYHHHIHLGRATYSISTSHMNPLVNCS